MVDSGWPSWESGFSATRELKTNLTGTGKRRNLDGSYTKETPLSLGIDLD